MIQTAANEISKSTAGDAARVALMPVGLYFDALDESAELGFKTVDSAIWNTGSNGVKANEMKLETLTETVNAETKGFTVNDNVVESNQQRSGPNVSSETQETRVATTTPRQVTNAPSSFQWVTWDRFQTH